MANALEQLTQHLARLATHYDMLGQWPDRLIAHLTTAGAWTWMIPREYGGLGLDATSQVMAYEAVAAGCMSSALILTQRDGACEFIASAENSEARNRLLPRLAANEIFTSIGISHLTTSRQGGKPSLTATPEGEDFVLNGAIPWVTGAVKCDGIVSAAVTPDGRQLLFWLQTNLDGVQIDQPMRLMALESALTSEVHCRNVRISGRDVLTGPCEDALKRRSPVKSLVVSSTGIGLARAMIRDLKAHVPEDHNRFAELLQEAVDRYEATRDRVFAAAADLDEPGVEIPKVQIRAAVNELLVKLAVAALTFGKGSGFIRQRDTQRLAREALFFLVWSAPDDVRIKTLSAFLDRPAPETRTMTL